jgi:hypothetical protein
VKVIPETKQSVTIWPREDRASGMVRDTEPGLQPWPATLWRIEYRDGKWFGVITSQGYRKYRYVELDLIRPA